MVTAERLDDEPGQRYLPITTIDPDGFYGSFVDCTPGHGYGLLGDYAEAERPNPGEATFAAYLTEVADALCEGRGLGDDDAPDEGEPLGGAQMSGTALAFGEGEALAEGLRQGSGR
ncbi:hypothetical protein ACGFOU_19325 [Streptomyces sp. NPDC048595]|uniref:hypothetical protein n=1 Tax=Streptomyces sp. NPDC048595 TaxID=3365576 RepID=UPI003713FCBD